LFAGVVFGLCLRFVINCVLFRFLISAGGLWLCRCCLSDAGLVGFVGRMAWWSLWLGVILFFILHLVRGSGGCRFYLVRRGLCLCGCVNICVVCIDFDGCLL